MSVYANGQLIYGFVHNNDTKDVFTAIVEKWEEQENGDNDACFEEMHEGLQEKYHVSLCSIGDANVNAIFAYSANAYAKGFSSKQIDSADMAKTEEYAENIKNFLEALGINASQHQPGWHILAYMD